MISKQVDDFGFREKVMANDKGEEIRAKVALARYIGLEFHSCDKLMPGERFNIAPMAGSTYWIDQKIDTIAWWTIAVRLNALSTRRVIDHAWMVQYGDGRGDNWAVVTEPYIDLLDAEKLASKAMQVMSRWELKIAVLPAEMGSWNPKGCIPIVITYTKGLPEVFFRRAALWALKGPLRGLSWPCQC